MKRLIVLLNMILKKHKELKKWQRVVTALAAVITFATTYALILPAITVEKDNTEDVSGMYLEESAEPVTTKENTFEEAVVPREVYIAADQENAVTYTYSDGDLSATAVFSTDEEIPEGAELVVNYIAPESDEFISLDRRASCLLEKEFITTVSTHSFYDFALVCDNVDVTPETGLADIQIIFRNNTVRHLDDALFAGRFALDLANDEQMIVSDDEVSASEEGLVDPSVEGSPSDEGFIQMSAGETTNEYDTDNTFDDELISVNSDNTSVIELSDGIIMSLTLKGYDLSHDDSKVGILAGIVDNELKEEAGTDMEITSAGEVQDTEEITDAELPENNGDETAAAPSIGTLTARGDDYTVNLTYDETSGMPEGAKLEVYEIAQDSAEYNTYLEETKIAMGLTEEETLPRYAARFFDIKIIVNGSEFTPKSGVTVEVAYAEPIAAKPETEVSAVHFEDEKSRAEVIEANTTDIANNGTATVEFQAESFSVYGIVYTVDFYWDVDGETYEYSMTGGDTMSLRELIKILRVLEDEDSASGESSNSETDDAAIESFLKNIESVEFSDDSLVKVVKVEEDTTAGALKESLGIQCEYSADLSSEEIAEMDARTFTAPDWALISIRAFDTEEYLTVTMKNGDSFRICVTDDQSDATMNTDGTTVQTIANPAGTTMDLFDYWVDDYLKDTVGRAAWPGFNSYNNDSGVTLNGTGNNAGINSSTSDTDHGHALKFSPANDGTVVDGTLNNWHKATKDGNVGVNSWTKSAIPRQGLVTNTLVNGYPQLSNDANLGTTDESLAYLFNNSTHAGKEIYTGVNNLLYVDPEGFYTFDSNDFNADFDTSNRKFTLTGQTAAVGEDRGFWPFGTKEYWFGLHMKTDFSMPANGLVLSPRGNYNPMTFEFQGDDDTWLYVDGILVGDGGGIHNQTLIRVDFETGEVLVSAKYDARTDYRRNWEETSYLDDLFRTGLAAQGKTQEEIDAYISANFDGHTFKSGTYHTFEMFYIERGGGESNLKIKYNLISTADFTAHKSYHGQNNERLLRDAYQFELQGLDGQYKYVDGNLVLEDASKRAIMPEGGSANGAGVVGDPKKEYKDGYTSYIVGVTEDGNVNFGAADFSSEEMHDCDMGNPSTYRYIIREFVPDEAVNPDGKTWAQATDEEKAEGGFVYNGTTYDGRIYYMTATVTRWQETNASGGSYWAYGLSKRYYTDATFETLDTDTRFISFVNGYVQPLHLKINKTGVWTSGGVQQQKALAGANFKLTRAKYVDGAWVERDTSTPKTGVTGSDGSLTFDNLVEGHYILEETEAPDGYQKSDNKWLVTIKKKDSETKIVLEPVITVLSSDGTVAEGTESETLEVTNDTFEKTIENLRNPRGDITVTKTWLKYNGQAYTEEELAALGDEVQSTTITGELWRKADNQVETTYTNPIVVLIGKNDNGNVELWRGRVKNGSTFTFSVGISQTTAPVKCYSDPPGEETGTITGSATTDPITYSGRYTGTKQSGAMVYSVTAQGDQDGMMYIYASFVGHSKSGASTNNNIGSYVEATETNVETYTETSGGHIDQQVGNFVLNSEGNWTKTWSRDSLNEDDELDYTYYLKNVTETPTLSDFTFVSDTVGTTDPTTGNITFIQKNTRSKETIDISVKKEWDPVPDSGSVTLKLRRYAKLTKGTLNLTLVSDQGGVIDGAVFELYKDGEATGQRYTTDANGEISVTGLEAGEYYLKQTSTPALYSMEGCTTETTPWEVKGDLTTPQVHEETLTNTALVTAGTFTIHLVNKNGDSLEGGVFNLYKEGESTPLVKGLETGSDGTWTRDSLDAGTYYFVQTAAPSGYILPSDTQSESFAVADLPGEEQSKTVTMVNAVKAKGSVTVTLTKTDGTAISGATFELYKNGSKIREGVTGSDGTVVFEDLSAGNYKIKQTTSSEGLNISTTEETFTVEENENTGQTFEYSYENEEATGHVTVKIYKARHNDVYNQEFVTDLTSLKPNKTYYIKVGVPETNVKDGDQVGICTDFVLGDAPKNVDYLEKDEWTSSGNPRYYTFAFTPTQDNKTYYIALVSRYWSLGSVSAELVDSNSLNSTVTTSRTLFSSVKKFASTLLGGFLGSSGTVTGTDAAPTAPEGYGNDPTFEEQTIVLSGGAWTDTISGLDKYDSNGDLYYYYVVETDRTPEDYWVESYSDAVGGGNGTLTVTNKKVTTGTVRVTKAFSGIDNLPSGFTITNSYNSNVFNVGNAVSTNPYTWEITEVPVGTVVTFTESGIQADGYSLTVNGTATSGESASVAASAVVVGDTVTASLTNTYEKNPGDLELTKKVAGDGADSTKQFEFTIELTAPSGTSLSGSYEAEHTGDNTVTTAAVTDGTVTGILLKAGEVYTIKDLPVGTSYKITESDYTADGYTSGVTNGTLEGTITGGPTIKEAVEITNTYTATSVTLKKVDKEDVTDDSGELLKGASFAVTKYDSSEFRNKFTSWGNNGTKTLTDEKDSESYTLNGVFTFTDLTVGFYEVEELVYPAGYVQLQDNPRFEVGNDMRVYLLDANGNRISGNSTELLRVLPITEDQQENVVFVGNVPGAALPNTGGPGTLPFTALGSILILFASLLLIRNKKAA